MGAQFARGGDEEEASERAQGDHGNGGRGFLAISDNVLTMGESAEGEEGADWPHSYPGDLLGKGA